MADTIPPLKLTCQDVIGLLIEYLEVTLSAEVLAAFERHLQDCPPCVAFLNTYRKTQDLTWREGPRRCEPASAISC